MNDGGGFQPATEQIHHWEQVEAEGEVKLSLSLQQVQAPAQIKI